MDLLVVAFFAVSLLAALLVIALGIAVRRSPPSDYEAEAIAMAETLRGTQA